ncbi:hypothetical protein BDQ17DRAFT_1334426 [Cyathus striatus]|nr:hypothetical protein BDQ17DRAFT_1334426 [Cyathus striatus]
MDYPEKQNRERVRPAGLLAWLDLRGLYWPCFCSIGAPDGETRRARIVHARNGVVHVFCYNYPPNCSYYMNISQKCETATLGSAYLNLPTKRIGCPDMGRIYANFLLASDDSSVSPVRMEGYCGEHLAGIAIQQQAILNPVATLNILGKRKRTCRALLPIPMPTPPKTHSPGATRVVKRVKKGTNKDLKPSTSDTNKVSGSEQPVTRLNEGEDIDTDGFLELCTSCGKYFLADCLKKYILGCSNS